MLDFKGAICRLTPPGVPAYDPSRWYADTKDDDAAYILETLPKTGDDSVTMRRIAMFKASPYMGIAECRHMAIRIVEACKRVHALDRAMERADAAAEILKCDYD